LTGTYTAGAAGLGLLTMAIGRNTSQASSVGKSTKKGLSRRPIRAS